MRPALRYALVLVLGAGLGAGVAVAQLRQGLADAGVANGPWRTAEGLGTADATLTTRALVALRGLLALPDREAIYYTASEDSAGQPLDGRCSYAVSGGTMPTRWWSITVYDSAGYLIPNPAGRHSIGSAALPPEAQGDWQVLIADAAPSGSEAAAVVPIGRPGPFELTLRAYHPRPALLANRATVPLPRIERLECAS